MLFVPFEQKHLGDLEHFKQNILGAATLFSCPFWGAATV